MLWYKLFLLSASVASSAPVLGILKGMLMCASAIGDLQAASQRGAAPTPSLLGAESKQALRAGLSDPLLRLRLEEHFETGEWLDVLSEFRGS